jgi:S1-C subfamily serine protease
MSELAAREAMRVVRALQVEFPSGPPKSGSGFVLRPGLVITCAHVVTNDSGQRATRVLVGQAGAPTNAVFLRASDPHDLACIEAPGETDGIDIDTDLPAIGRTLLFAGQPQGVSVPSVFPGLVSMAGPGLLKAPRCDLIQVAGMINNGNSGGPLLDALTGRLLGVITAKYVPLLQEIDKMVRELEQIPQFPSAVGVQGIDFGKFVNLTVRALWQVSAVLRLVQVGTGWAVPSKYLRELGV